MRSISLLAVIACAACGGAGSARGPSSPASPGSPSSPQRASAADASSPPAVCKRLAEVAPRCPQLGVQEVDVAGCVRELESSADAAFTQEFLRVAGPCLARETQCDPLIECMAAIGESQALRSCRDVGNAGLRVGLPRAEWERRKGASATTFREARSTKDAPIEMCGVTDANLWLTTLRCGDGAQPLRDRGDAEKARLGNVGPGGRCGSIIDRYLVSCPEAGYEIFMDAYICASPDP